MIDCELKQLKQVPVHKMLSDFIAFKPKERTPPSQSEKSCCNAFLIFTFDINWVNL